MLHFIENLFSFFTPVQPSPKPFWHTNLLFAWLPHLREERIVIQTCIFDLNPLPINPPSDLTPDTVLLELQKIRIMLLDLLQGNPLFNCTHFIQDMPATYVAQPIRYGLKSIITRAPIPMTRLFHGMTSCLLWTALNLKVNFARHAVKSHWLLNGSWTVHLLGQCSSRPARYTYLINFVQLFTR
jgi:hypothetical protein